MNTTELQNLYWETETIHDKLQAMEQYIRKLTKQGKSCIKTYEKYFSLIDELRANQAQMVLLEAGIETFSA